MKVQGVSVDQITYDKSVNRTFAVVHAPEFTQTFYVSGHVSAESFLSWVAPTVERMRAELATGLRGAHS